ncbi:DUF4124 domain-containing protein [Microbulbifer magnicolonia]|uniref:DUF4124 domain-containing protein n=1 Tax=Microbulbifer magnicolonia TaxID=3109744 RepID=UPI002B40A067|nr:DUF4124 domain-containing protein [Microbulbifer sp. GG15]
MKSVLGALLLGGLLLSGAAACAGELYRWVDAEGKVHFGDRPPLEARAENIGGELRPINSADAPAPQQTASRRQQLNPEREYDNRQRQRELQQQQQMTRACNAARRDLRLLQGRVAVIDANGKEIKMTERERQEQADRLQREIARVCG